jgi:site-specific DNA-methyltransferase (adenine-specific)
METNKIYQGDCLELMKQIEDKSVDLILCDLPYGTTACSWDIIIPLDKLWEQYKRIIKDNGAIVLTAQQPFTSVLICSNLEMFKYNWIWKKDNGTNFITSHYQPLRITEEVCVFGKLGCSWNKKGNMQYYPQFEKGKPYVCKSGKQKGASIIRGGAGGWDTMHGFETISDGKRYPKNLLEFNRDKEKVHPTQKPVVLFEYLIKTYTNEGDLVLDNCVGSGTTAIACIRTNRNYIGIELSEEYVKIANERIQKELSQSKLNNGDGIPPKPKDLGILPNFI